MEKETKIIELEIPDSRQLDRFFKENRPKAISFMKSRFSVLSDDVIEDIYHESCIALYQNIQSGKLTKLTTSLFNYFLSICKNLCLKYVRDHAKEIRMSEKSQVSDDEDEIQPSKVESLGQSLWGNSGINEKLLDAIDQIVNDLPDPCDKILWGMYRDGHSQQTIGEIYGYTTTSVKTLANRCRNKFKERFLEIKNKIYG